MDGRTSREQYAPSTFSKVGGIKLFPKLPKSRHPLHQCLNAFEIKTCKGELFLLANDTENEIFNFYVQTELDV